MMNVAMLSVIMLNVVMLSVVYGRYVKYIFWNKDLKNFPSIPFVC
jgi:hypothetical protein